LLSSAVGFWYGESLDRTVPEWFADTFAKRTRVPHSFVDRQNKVFAQTVLRNVANWRRPDGLTVGIVVPTFGIALCAYVKGKI